MNTVVLQALLPVLGLITLGFVLRRLGLVGEAGTQRWSQAVFWGLIPLYLLLTMSRVNLHDLRVGPVAAYFVGAACIIGGAIGWQGLSRRAVVWGLAATFSNNVMIGLPLVAIALGAEGSATLMSLLAVHSLVLLTTATCLLEIASAKERRGQGLRGVAKLLGQAAIKTIVHPVPLPIIMGLMWSASGMHWPVWLEAPYAVLTKVFGPMALMLVGLSLAGGQLRTVWRSATVLALAKNMVFPLLVALVCKAWGLSGVGATTMVLAASLPIGANVLLFAQRYDADEALVSAAITLSSVAAILSVTLVLLLMV